MLRTRNPQVRASQLRRVLIVSDVQLYLQGIAAILDRRPEVEVCGTAAHTGEAVECAARLAVQLVLLDMGMPDAVDLVRKMVRALPEVRILAIAVSEDEDEVIACAEAGVSGYLTRASSLEDLIAAVRSIEHGEVLCSPWMAATLLKRVGALASGARRGSTAQTRLTRRELEIVELLDAGLSNKEIATRLVIQVATVKNHVHNILKKLHVERRSDVGRVVHGSRSMSYAMRRDTSI